MSKTSSPGLTDPGENQRRSLVLRVSARRYRSAEAMARECSGRDLPTVVRALVGDLASAARRGRCCWQHELLAGWLARHPWPRREPEENL